MITAIILQEQKNHKCSDVRVKSDLDDNYFKIEITRNSEDMNKCQIKTMKTQLNATMKRIQVMETTHNNQSTKHRTKTDY